MLHVYFLLSVGRHKKDCVYSDDRSYSPVLTPKEPPDIECEEHVEIEIVKYGDIVRQLKNSQVRIKTFIAIMTIEKLWLKFIKIIPSIHLTLIKNENQSKSVY